MELHGTDRIDDPEAAETPEDVAVLYSWANLHGAKYRDFSASRREYRAQLRHRAAEQVREQALLAQAEAEAAAVAADSTARHAAQAANTQTPTSDSTRQRSLREAEDAARTAAAERVEAARRAEAAAVAEAAARREEREIAEAHASAQRQAARYADSEIRRKSASGVQTVPVIPGKISDPYTPPTHTSPPQQQPTVPQAEAEPAPQQPAPVVAEVVEAVPYRRSDDQAGYASAPVRQERAMPAAPALPTPRRPQGYRPDDASGVRQIYRGPEYDKPRDEQPSGESVRRLIPTPSRPVSTPAQSQQSRETKLTPEQPQYSQRMSQTDYEAQPAVPGHGMGQRRTDRQPQPESRYEDSGAQSTAPVDSWVSRSSDPARTVPAGYAVGRDSIAAQIAAGSSRQRPAPADPMTSQSAPSVRAVSPFSQALIPSDSVRGRRAQDDFDYQQAPSGIQTPRRPAPGSSGPLTESATTSSQRPPYAADPAGPAWLYAPPAPQAPPRPIAPQSPVPQSSVADTLQHSRERVAARWFALKGVFEQPGQEVLDAAPVRQKETRTPVLAVFSLAGGVGKTSLVATVGRSLSSLGEKVLLTDTTSHGLLPFYFGASELRQGTVRTFSPPSGSTDAPIYLVSYDVEQKGRDDEAQELLVEEIVNNSRGTHRILLDLTSSSSWIVRRMARMNPTVLVPVAPDMNSVISLQTVERFFHGAIDGDGRALQPYYVLNQFDTSLPLHLDVREVLRRQLGDRLLPFVIRRAPAVSEALAEGMTVVDYAPDAPVAEDYLNLATWLRTVAAPATAGFRNVRWSER
jgi:cellulose synthase operon protein YhjQ